MARAPGDARTEALPAVSLALLAAIAALTLYRGAFDASNLDYSPDAVEYALVAHRYASEGRLGIKLEGRLLPSRYPPWFPVLLLAPAYALFGEEIGNAIFPVTTLAVAGIAIAFAIGSLGGSPWGGAAAGLAVLAIPAYQHWGRQVMTDVPNAVLLLGACWCYVRARCSPQTGDRNLVWAGLLVALAALLRPLSAAALLPFALLAVSAGGAAARLRRLAWLALPVVAAGGLTLVYNRSVFGSMWRNGYQFWCAVPYDYPSMLFSPSHVVPGLRALGRSGEAPLLVAAALLLFGIHALMRRRRRGAIGGADAVAEFLVLGAGPTAVAYLFYFHREVRFHLPWMALSAVLAGCVLGKWLARLPPALLPICLAVLLGDVYTRTLREPSPAPPRRLAADRILKHTPDDALILSAIDPVYLQYLVGRGSQRRVMPLSREIEYASKLIVRRRIEHPDPKPRGARDHRAPALLAAGAEEGVLRVAAERWDALAEQIRGGAPVFVETSLADPGLRAQNLPATLWLEPVAESLYRLNAYDR